MSREELSSAGVLRGVLWGVFRLDWASFRGEEESDSESESLSSAGVLQGVLWGVFRFWAGFRGEVESDSESESELDDSRAVHGATSVGAAASSFASGPGHLCCWR